MAEKYFNEKSIVEDVLNDPAFNGFAHLLFPIDLSISRYATLSDISTSNVYIWYNNIKVKTTIEILNYLKTEALNHQQIFYSIYTDEEIRRDPNKKDTGLFFFRGNEYEKFAIMSAGGGMMYVGAMHDSFPHALEASKNGYNAFALIYRPNSAYDDLAQAIKFVYDHSDELKVKKNSYSLWGGSAGARMAATLANKQYLNQLTQRDDIPQATAVIMQYTGHSQVNQYDAPTYACIGTNDWIADWRVMQNRLNKLEKMGIPTELHVYDGLPHGFGLGLDIKAEGWIKQAFKFWETQK